MYTQHLLYNSLHTAGRTEPKEANFRTRCMRGVPAPTGASTVAATITVTVTVMVMVTVTTTKNNIAPRFTQHCSSLGRRGRVKSYAYLTTSPPWEDVSFAGGTQTAISRLYTPKNWGGGRGGGGDARTKIKANERAAVITTYGNNCCAAWHVEHNTPTALLLSHYITSYYTSSISASCWYFMTATFRFTPRSSVFSSVTSAM